MVSGTDVQTIIVERKQMTVKSQNAPTAEPKSWRQSVRIGKRSTVWRGCGRPHRPAQGGRRTSFSIRNFTLMTVIRRFVFRGTTGTFDWGYRSNPSASFGCLVTWRTRVVSATSGVIRMTPSS
jgi:hypothetical protein